MHLRALLPGLFQKPIERLVVSGSRLGGRTISMLGQFRHHIGQPVELRLRRFLDAAQLGPLLLNLLEHLPELLTALEGRLAPLILKPFDRLAVFRLLDRQRGTSTLDLFGFPPKCLLGLTAFGLPVALALSELSRQRLEFVEHFAKEGLELAVAGAQIGQGISDRVPAGSGF